MLDFCNDLDNYGEVKIFTKENIGAVNVTLGILYFIMSLIIMYFIRYQELRAEKGDERAVQSVIFPIFVKMLWINAFINIYIAIIILCFDFDPYEVSSDEGGIWSFAIMYALQHWLIEGVAILLMQKGLGRNAAYRSLRIAVVWGIFSLFVHWALLNGNRTLAFSLDFVWNMLLLIFYSFLWLAPTKRFYRRPAAIFYAKFWTIYRLFVIIFSSFYFIPTTANVAPCFYTFGCLFPFALFEPLVLYHTFLQDSKWWQGLEIQRNSTKAGGGSGGSKKNGDGSHKNNANTQENIKSPLYGIDLNLTSAQSLAASMDHLGISSNAFYLGTKQKDVKLLNFAYITLDRNKMLGTGSFSRVYLGKYRQRPCAIKLVYTMDVTKEIIARIAAEAEILSSIKSRNVVEILGVSVLPPSVCILLELCQYGTLGDVIHGTGYAALSLSDPAEFMKHFVVGGNPVIGKQSKQNLNISWTDRLYLAIGCAKGIAAVHALRSDICHRDIKSFNFLVDEHFNAKICDLELGTTRDKTQMKKKYQQFHQKPTVRLSSGGSNQSFAKKMSNTSWRSSDPESGSSRPSDLSDSEIELPDTDASRSRETENNIDGASPLQGEDFLANWSAPEVISDARFSQASDIYSFGLVLWELLIGKPPFSEIRSQQDIRDRVLNEDYRPVIPECFLMPPYEIYFLPFIDLIRRCWSKEPLLRPSISFVLEKLQALYQKQCYNIVFETSAVENVMINAHNSDNNSDNLSRPSQMKVRTYSFRSSQATKTPQNQRISFYSNMNTHLCQQIQTSLQDEANIIERFLETDEAWCLCLPDSTFITVWCSPRFAEYFQIPVKEMMGKSLLSLDCFEMNNSPTAAAATANSAAGNRKKKFSLFGNYSPFITRSAEKNDKQMKRRNKIQIFFNNLQENLKPGQEHHSMLELSTNKLVPKRRPSEGSGHSVENIINNMTGGGGGSKDKEKEKDGPEFNLVAQLALYSLHCFPVINKPPLPSPSPVVEGGGGGGGGGAPPLSLANPNNNSMGPSNLSSSPVPPNNSATSGFRSPQLLVNNPNTPNNQLSQSPQLTNTNNNYFRAREPSHSFDGSMNSPSTGSSSLVGYHGNMRASHSANPTALANPNALIQQLNQQQQQQQGQLQPNQPGGISSLLRESEFSNNNNAMNTRSSVGGIGESFVGSRSTFVNNNKERALSISNKPSESGLIVPGRDSDRNPVQSVGLVAILFNKLKDL